MTTITSNRRRNATRPGRRSASSSRAQEASGADLVEPIEPSPITEHFSSAQDAEVEESYWPLLRSAAFTALAAFAANTFVLIFLALQNGATIGFDRVLIFPLMRIYTADASLVLSIYRWSLIATVVTVAILVVAAFVRRTSTQTQMGRSFGFLDVAGIGAFNLVSGLFGTESILLHRLMVYMLIGGLLGFAVSFWLASDLGADHHDPSRSTA